MTYQPSEIVLDKYRVEAVLGAGAFGEVYRVMHLGLKVTRAIKVLRRDAPGIGSFDYRELQTRFMLEAQLGAMLNSPSPHPNLLQVHDVHLADDLLLLEMEFAPGGDLTRRIQEKRETAEVFPIGAALKIAAETANGLAALHKRDIVHRDLKPANILFDENGTARLADLGLAQVPGGASQRSRLSTPVAHPGTPGYMSPEQETSGSYLTSASDVYALGVVLFELLTGRAYRSLRPGTRARTLRAEIPGALDELLARLLARSAEERPWDGEETLALLRGIQNGQAEEQARLNAIKKAQVDKLENERLEQERERKARADAEAKDRREAEAQQELARLAALAKEKAAAAERARLDLPASENARLSPAAQIKQAREAAESLIAQRDRSEPPEKSLIARFWPLGLIMAGLVLVLVFGIGSWINRPAQATPAPAIMLQTVVVIQTAQPDVPVSAAPTLTPWIIPTTTPYLTPIVPTTIAPVPSEITQEGAVMRLVPGGSFEMGSANGEADEIPVGQVTLAAFYMDVYEVTNVLYKVCEDAGACKKPVDYGSYTHTSYYDNSLYNNFPVIYVDWNMAKSYCAWRGGRLPTEAEWEYAARGTDGRVYPWGDRIDKTYANYEQTGIGDTTAVGSYPKGLSPFGMYDMAGNVWEWVSSEYRAYPYNAKDGREDLSTGADRVLRGGGWGNYNSSVRSAYRGGNNPANSYFNLGFRCARSQ